MRLNLTDAQLIMDEHYRETSADDNDTDFAEEQRMQDLHDQWDFEWMEKQNEPEDWNEDWNEPDPVFESDYQPEDYFDYA